MVAAIPATRLVSAPTQPILLHHPRSYRRRRLIRPHTSHVRARRPRKVLEHAPTAAISAERAGANRRRVGDGLRHAVCVRVRMGASVGVEWAHHV